MKYKIKIGGLEMGYYHIHEADNMKGIIDLLISHIAYTSGDDVDIKGLEKMWNQKSKYNYQHYPLEESE